MDQACIGSDRTDILSDCFFILFFSVFFFLSVEGEGSSGSVPVARSRNRSSTLHRRSHGIAVRRRFGERHTNETVCNHGGGERDNSFQLDLSPPPLSSSRSPISSAASATVPDRTERATSATVGSSPSGSAAYTSGSQRSSERCKCSGRMSFNTSANAARSTSAPSGCPVGKAPRSNWRRREATCGGVDPLLVLLYFSPPPSPLLLTRRRRIDRYVCPNVCEDGAEEPELTAIVVAYAGFGVDIHRRLSGLRGGVSHETVPPPNGTMFGWKLHSTVDGARPIPTAADRRYPECRLLRPRASAAMRGAVDSRDY